MVDPATDEVIAKSCDRRYLHPLQHVVMVIIDLAARSQAGGAWSIDCDGANALVSVRNIFLVSKSNHVKKLPISTKAE